MQSGWGTQQVQEAMAQIDFGSLFGEQEMFQQEDESVAAFFDFFGF